MARYPFEIKPMTVGTILDHTFRIYRANFLQIAFFSIVISGLSSSLIQLVAFAASGGIVRDLSGVDMLRGFTMDGSLNSFLSYFEQGYYSSPEEIIASMFAVSSVTAILGFLMQIFATSFVNGGIANITAGYYHGVSGKMRVWLTRTGRFYWQLVLLGICVGLFYVICVIVLTIILLIIFFALSAAVFMSVFSIGVFGIIAALILFALFIIPVAMLFNIINTSLLMAYSSAACEGKFHFTAVFRGIQVFFFRFWKSAWISLLIYIITFFCTLAVELLYAAIFMWLPVPAVINNISTVLLSSLFMPIPVICSTLIYINNRIEKEGYDLILMSDAAHSLSN